MEKEFYKQLKAFLKEVIIVFPDDDEIKVISTKINLSCLEEDIDLIYKFFSSLERLEDYLLNKDDEFFRLNPSAYWKETSQEHKLFSKLMYYWSVVSENNKNVIWDYLNVIYKLSKVIYLNKKV